MRTERAHAGQPTLRLFWFVAALAAGLCGCTTIRGTASGPDGGTWYVRAGHGTAKVTEIHYCPKESEPCVEARIVSREEYEDVTAAR